MFEIRIDDDTSLSLLEDQHADELFALIDQNRAHLRKWLPWLDQNTKVEHTRGFIRSVLQQFAARNGFSCGIRFRGALVGVIGLHYIDWVNRKSSIGYWIAEPFQGRGLVSKACAALLDYLFDELKLNCVEIACGVENTRSRAIPQRLGFTKEGILRQREWLYDHFVDHSVYSMLASQWRRRPSRTSS